MRAGHGVAAVLAAAAGARLGAVAEEALAQPEGDALLADAARSVQQKRAGEGVATDGVVEPAAEGGVAVERQQGHARRYARAMPPRKAAGCRRPRL
jgi:hypothetical protein